MSPSSSGIKGGQPSTTQPIADPWLSPKVVTRKRWPKVLWDMGDDRQGKRLDLGLNLTGDLFWRFRRMRDGRNCCARWCATVTRGDGVFQRLPKELFFGLLRKCHPARVGIDEVERPFPCRANLLFLFGINPQNTYANPHKIGVAMFAPRPDCKHNSTRCDSYRSSSSDRKLHYGSHRVRLHREPRLSPQKAGCPKGRHCEERSDKAIQSLLPLDCFPLRLRLCGRNDGAGAAVTRAKAAHARSS